MPTSPGPLLAALQALWERIRADAPELPPIRPTVSPTRRRYDHGPERWQEEDGTLGGFVVTADILQAGAGATLEYVLHEAAHVLNWRRGVQDTTTRGAYHTQAFLTAAEEVGLVWPEGAERSATRGFIDVELSDAARKRYARSLQELDVVIPLVLPHLELPKQTSSRTPDRLTLVCQCTPPRKLRVSRTVAAQGAITCGVCGQPFAEE
jgi:hypothetical protein